MRNLLMLISIVGALVGIVSMSPAKAADKIGIVFMHGLQGLPNDRTIGDLGKTLDGAGYLVDEPEMCWSRTRAFDKSYTDCLAEVDPAIAKLRAKGATAIIVMGMSIGGNGALGYGATHDGLKGIVALAPAADPMGLMHNPVVAKSIERAKSLLAAGKGDAGTDFNSINGPRTITVHATPKIFLTFYGEGSPGRIPDNTAKLKAPLLWVAGTDDPSQRGGQAFAFDKAPANPLNRYVSVSSDHLGTPTAGKDAVLAWLKDLAAH